MKEYLHAIKKDAKGSLKGNWQTAIGLMLLPAVISGGVMSVMSIFGVIPILGSLASIAATIGVYFISFPLDTGAKSWYFHLTYVERPPFNLLFSRFKKGLYGQSVGMNFARLLYVYIYVLVPSIILGIFVGVFIVWGTIENAFPTTFSSSFTTWQSLFIIVIFLLFYIAIVIFAVIVQLRYSIADYLCVRFPGMRPFAAVKKSAKLLKGKLWDVFSLNLNIFAPLYIVFIIMLVSLFGFIFLLAGSRISNGYSDANFAAVWFIGFIGMLMFSCLGIIALSFYLTPIYEASLARFARFTIEEDINNNQGINQGA